MPEPPDGLVGASGSVILQTLLVFGGHLMRISATLLFLGCMAILMLRRTG